MADIINKYLVLHMAFTKAREVHHHATFLRGQSSDIPFDVLMLRIDLMRQAYTDGISPLLDLGTAAQINPVIGTFFAGDLPADTYAQFQALQAALGAFNAAYDSIFDALTPMDYDPASGHSYALVPLAQLATVADELDAVIAAAAPITPE